MAARAETPHYTGPERRNSNGNHVLLFGVPVSLWVKIAFGYGPGTVLAGYLAYKGAQLLPLIHVEVLASKGQHEIILKSFEDNKRLLEEQNRQLRRICYAVSKETDKASCSDR